MSGGCNDASGGLAREREPALSRRQFCLLAAAHGLTAFVPGLALAAPAAKIACIDWAAAESLARLGHMPVAVPELATYRHWLPDPALPAATVDLGSRSEPNLELLSALHPDRIFIPSWQSAMRAQFSRIAPTEQVVLFDERRDPYGRIRELMLQAGRVVGRREDARHCLSEFDTALERLRLMLRSQSRRALYVVVLVENGAQAFVYGKGSWVDTVIARIGLRNAWTGRTSFYGNSLVGIYELAADPDAAILYLDQGARTRRAEARLRASTLWRSLPAVAAGRAAAIPAFYALGGIPSALRCARILTAAMRDVAGAAA
jgi:iron complex transport system substrate-binding protein